MTEYEIMAVADKLINEKDKQISQLTNNWNELEEWLIDLYKKGYDIKLVLDKMKEIKEGK